MGKVIKHLIKAGQLLEIQIDQNNETRTSQHELTVMVLLDDASDQSIINDEGASFVSLPEWSTVGETVNEVLDYQQPDTTDVVSVIMTEQVLLNHDKLEEFTRVSDLSNENIV